MDNKILCQKSALYDTLLQSVFFYINSDQYRLQNWKLNEKGENDGRQNLVLKIINVWHFNVECNKTNHSTSNLKIKWKGKT